MDGKPSSDPAGIGAGVGVGDGEGLGAGVVVGVEGAAAGVAGEPGKVTLLSPPPDCDLQPETLASAIASARNIGFERRAEDVVSKFFMIMRIRHNHLISAVALWLTNIRHKV
jgi:hypothetical protein